MYDRTFGKPIRNYKGGKIREYSQEIAFDEAVEVAVDECIKEGVLEEFLRKNRAEVISVSIFEYDEERHLQQERTEAWKVGYRNGKEKVNILIERLLADNRIEELKRSAKDEKYQRELMEEYGIKPDMQE